MEKSNFDGKPLGTFIFQDDLAKPHPEKVVKSIDFVSTKTDAAPFVVAITAE